MIDQSPVIELRRLHRFFGVTRAVDDVSFEVGRGQVFGFIGPNGAGKTTSMRILATLDVPTAGDALIDGFSVINDPDRVRCRLGFMPDYFGTYANINCHEYIDFFARAYGLRGTERRRAINRVMSFTGLDALAQKPIAGLSKGMKQRLCLGRSIVHDPAVLILDEPAAGLDPRARVELRAMIRQLALDGKTVLISSHILTELAEICDLVAIIEQGRLLATGTVDEIQRGFKAHRALVIRIDGGGEKLHQWLAARPDWHDTRLDGELVYCSHTSDRHAEIELLRQIVAAGFPVAEFGSHQTSLEDIFMQVTQGKVQ